MHNVYASEDMVSLSPLPMQPPVHSDVSNAHEYLISFLYRRPQCTPRVYSFYTPRRHHNTLELRDLPQPPNVHPTQKLCRAFANMAPWTNIDGSSFRIFTMFQYVYRLELGNESFQTSMQAFTTHLHMHLAIVHSDIDLK